MKRSLVFLFLLLISLVSAEGVVYSLTLTFENGDFTLNDAQLYTSALPEERELEEYNYVAKIVSFQGDVLDEQKMFVSTQVYDLEIEMERKIEVLFFPYYENAKGLQIFTREGRKIAEFSLASFAQCNEDERCDPFESENCGDCLEREISRQIIQGLEEETAPVIGEEKEISLIRISIVVLGVFILLSIVIFLFRIKKSKTV